MFAAFAAVGSRPLCSSLSLGLADAKGRVARTRARVQRVSLSAKKLPKAETDYFGRIRGAFAMGVSLMSVVGG